jgi:hypothetical protein
MRSEVLRVAKTSTYVFWVVTLCGFVEKYSPPSGYFIPEEGDRVFLFPGYVAIILVTVITFVNSKFSENAA